MRTCILPPPRTTGTYAGHGAVDEGAALVGQRPLSVEREVALEMKRARRDFHRSYVTIGRRATTSRNAEPAETAEQICALRAQRALRSIVAIAAVLLAPRAAAAHPGAVQLPRSARCSRTRSTARSSPTSSTSAHDLNIEPAERLLDPAVASQQAAAIAHAAGGRADGHRRRPDARAAVVVGVEVLPDRQSLKLSLRFALAGRPGRAHGRRGDVSRTIRSTRRS